MRTRERLARKLNKHIPEYQWQARLFDPATGAWRTNKMLDVWCWETFVKDEWGISNHIGSYQTMTELCKCDQFSVDRDGELLGWMSD